MYSMPAVTVTGVKANLSQWDSGKNVVKYEEPKAAFKEISV